MSVAAYVTNSYIQKQVWEYNIKTVTNSIHAMYTVKFGHANSVEAKC